VEPAIGVAANEFKAFQDVYTTLPDLDDILDGKSKDKFPKDPSKRYAIILGLVVRATTAQKGFHALKWVADNADAEWLQFFVTSLFPMLREKGGIAPLMNLVAADAELKSITTRLRDMLLSH